MSPDDASASAAGEAFVGAAESPPPQHDRTSEVDPAPDAAEEAAPIDEALDRSREHLRGLLEALVFASDKPVGAAELARTASAPPKQVRTLMGELREHYARRGIVLEEVAGGWVFRTSAQYAPFVRELTSERPTKLTRAQIETLAIAAYRQPITRPEIDEIRGVDSGATLKLLLERELVRILGKKDEPGRPLLYGTTPHFLQFFGLKSLRDLPTLREFTELSDDSRRLAEAELGAVLPEAMRAPAPGPLASEAPHDGASMPAATEPPVRPGADVRDTVIPSAPPTGDFEDPPDSAQGGG